MSAAELTPHDWTTNNDSMPPTYRCIRCGVQKMFDPRRGVSIFYMDRGSLSSPFNYAGEPQCHLR